MHGTGTVAIRIARLGCLLSVVFSTAVFAQDVNPRTHNDGAYEARTFALPIRVDFDPLALDLDFRRLQTLIKAREIVYPAAMSALGLEPDPGKIYTVVDLEFSPVKDLPVPVADNEVSLRHMLEHGTMGPIVKGPPINEPASGRVTGWLLVSIRKDAQGVPVKAESFARALRSRLEAVLRELDAQAEQSLQRQVDDAEHAFARANDERSKLEEKRRKLGMDAAVSMGRETVQQNIEQYEKTRQSLELERIGLAARRSAMEEQLARVAKLVEQRTVEDEVVKHLMHIVELRMTELNRVQTVFDSGQASSGEMNAAKEQLAKAQADVARQRQNVLQSAGAERIARIQEELDRVITELAGTEARISFLNQQLERLRSPELISKLMQSEALYLQQNRADAALAQAAELREQRLERLHRHQRPTVTVIDEPKPAPTPDKK